MIFSMIIRVICLHFKHILDELGLMEKRGAKKKASTSPKTWANAQILREAEAF